MGSEEWVKHTCLVFLDEVVICWISNETWKISTGENHARDSQGHGHLQIKRHISVSNNAVTSPHSTISLWTQESWPRQNKWPLLTIVSGPQSLPRSSVHQCSISVVNPPMLHYCWVLKDMCVSHGHTHLFNFFSSLEHWRFIHIVPRPV